MFWSHFEDFLSYLCLSVSVTNFFLIVRVRCIGDWTRMGVSMLDILWGIAYSDFPWKVVWRVKYCMKVAFFKWILLWIIFLKVVWLWQTIVLWVYALCTVFFHFNKFLPLKKKTIVLCVKAVVKLWTICYCIVQ